MEEARVAVFLVSANSLSSEFILHQEMPYLLARRSEAGMTVFPIICEDCLWQEVPWLAKLQARPRDGKALESFLGRRNSELVKIAREILEILRQEISSPLHQLPPPPADFTGREEDLAALRAALTQDGAGTILCLRGIGGVGKTALALKLAKELTPEFPDAQFFLDLKGVDAQPLTPVQAMGHVIRSYQPGAPLPEYETELAAVYRFVLHAKRVLLLMDNAASREQVEPLVPPVGSLLLVTSRQNFTLRGMVVREVIEMQAEDARNLLLKISSRIGKEADEIARLCSGLPLALRLAGSALAMRPNLSPSEYAGLLKKGLVA